ncbi:MAG: RtcB family protein, partial [Bacilli bacterium]
MFDTSEYNLKIFTDNIEQEALDQIYDLVRLPQFRGAKIRIMPDAHAGAGCVIGFTGDLGDKIIPNIVGVDISCGMLTFELGKRIIDLPKLDRFIKSNIPYSYNVYKEKQIEYD